MNKLLYKISLFLVFAAAGVGVGPALAADEQVALSAQGIHYSDWDGDINTGLTAQENFNLRWDSENEKLISFNSHEEIDEGDTEGYERPSLFNNNLFLLAIIGGIAVAASGGGGSSKKGGGYEEKLVFNNPADPTEIEISLRLDSLYDKSITISTQAGNYYFCKLTAEKCALAEKIDGNNKTTYATVGVFLGKRPAVYKDNISTFIATVSLTTSASAELTSDYDLPRAVSLKFTQNTLNYQENYQISELIPPQVNRQYGIVHVDTTLTTVLKRIEQYQIAGYGTVFASNTLNVTFTFAPPAKYSLIFKLNKDDSEIGYHGANAGFTIDKKFTQADAWYAPPPWAKGKFTYAATGYFNYKKTTQKLDTIYAAELTRQLDATAARFLYGQYMLGHMPRRDTVHNYVSGWEVGYTDKTAGQSNHALAVGLAKNLDYQTAPTALKLFWRSNYTVGNQALKFMVSHSWRDGQATARLNYRYRF